MVLHNPTIPQQASPPHWACCMLYIHRNFSLWSRGKIVLALMVLLFSRQGREVGRFNTDDLVTKTLKCLMQHGYVCGQKQANDLTGISLHQYLHGLFLCF